MSVSNILLSLLSSCYIFLTSRVGRLSTMNFVKVYHLSRTKALKHTSMLDHAALTFLNWATQPVMQYMVMSLCLATNAGECSSGVNRKRNMLNVKTAMLSYPLNAYRSRIIARRSRARGFTSMLPTANWCKND